MAELNSFNGDHVLIWEGCLNIPQAAWLKQHWFPFSSGGWKSEIKLLAGLGLKPLSLAVDAAFSKCPHMAFPLCVCVLIPSSYKDTSQIRLGPLNDLILPLQSSISKYSHILRYWGLGLQHMNLMGVGVQFSVLQRPYGHKASNIYYLVL